MARMPPSFCYPRRTDLPLGAGRTRYSRTAALPLGALRARYPCRTALSLGAGGAGGPWVTLGTGLPRGAFAPHKQQRNGEDKR